MNRGKATERMKTKWKEQYEMLACNEYFYDQLNEQEEDFILSIGKLLQENKDLSFHQSKWLNDICNKYQ